MTEFDNIERRRYYGIRVGDIVEEIFGKSTVRGEVTQYGFMDNNCVYVLPEGKTEEVKCVAEWCRIITKVEDKPADDGWISIHDKTKKMPVRENFYVKFNNGEIRMHFDKYHPAKALITHYKLLPETINTKP